MPFMDEAQPAGLLPQGAPEVRYESATPPFGKLLEAAFERENSMGSLIEQVSQGPAAPYDKSFDPWAHIKGYEDYAESFMETNSLEDVARMKGRIDKERQRAALLASGGALGMAAEVVAGIADPINLIPIGGEAISVGRAGARLLSGAARVGGAAAVSGVASELVLQATQETRTAQESAINVAAQTLLGGVLGGAVATAVGRDLSSLTKGMMGESDQLADDMAANIPNTGGSLSAAATSSRTMDSESVARLGKIPEAMAFSAPTLRTQTSPVLPTRVLAQELAEQPLMTKGNLEGQASPIAAESLIRQWQYPLAKGLTEVDNLFVKYRLGREPQFGDVARIGISDVMPGQQAKLSRDAFMEAVGKAMRRNDESEIPEVAQAAKALRKNVFDPLKDQAVKLGLLPEDVDPGTAASYLMRQYNYGKIAAERNRFSDIITDWYAAEQAKKAEIQVNIRTATEEMNAVRAEMARSDLPPERLADLERRYATLEDQLQANVMEWRGKAAREAQGSVRRREGAGEGATEKRASLDPKVMEGVDRILSVNTRLDRTDLQDIARQTIDRILGTPAGRLAYDVQTPSPGFMRADDTPDLRAKALKGRVFMIPDTLIEDFLESDASIISRAYVRTMAPDVTLAEKGWLDFDEKIKPILENYEQLRQKTQDPKELTKLNDRMQADIRDVKAIYERLRGTYAMPSDPNSLVSRGFRVIRDLNYLRLLGGMTISALPDIGRTVMQHGFTRIFRDGFVPMVTGWKQFRLAAQEVKMTGEALDMVLDSRAMSLADIMEDYGRHSKFERGLQKATGQFGVVSLMAPWNSALKQLVGVVSQTRSLQAMEKLATGKLDKAERTRLAQFGIGEDEARAIAKQFAAHGEKHGSLWWANTDAWTDRRAAEAYRAAISREINQVIVTPGQEKPLWMSTEWGKVLGQFKSFAFSSMQRVTLAGLQQRDAAVLNGAALMIGLGALSYYIRTDHDRLSDDPAVWIKEGIDRSGLTGWMFEANNIIEKMTRGSVGASRLVGGPMASRYASRGVLESLLGPTAGLVNDAAQVTGSAATGDWRESDSRAVRRMLPLQNLIGLKYAFDAAEAGLNAATGVPQ